MSDRCLLTFYSGRKYYQPLEDAYKLDLSFCVAALQQKYLGIELTGKKALWNGLRSDMI
jgi:hypothetical protein